jgi:D-alanyl-D-alanine carboxypeptidase
MNIVAKKCGMKSSKFCNPHGLPNSQSYSNAEDLASLMCECLRIELFKTVIKTKKYNFWTEHQGVQH